MRICFAEVGWSAQGRRILDAASLSAESGRLTGIVGPNGSGKSSLLRCLYRALEPDTGAVLLDGQDIRALPRRRLAAQVAAVPQEAISECRFTLREMVLMGRYAGRGAFSPLNKDDHACAQRAIEQMDLAGLERQPFMQLSGGERQRVLLARALAQDAPALVLDEPTNHLDIRHSLALLELLRQLNLTTLAVLHDLNLAAAYCDQVVVIAQGRVAASGPPGEVFTQGLLRQVFGVEVALRREQGRPQLCFLGPSQGLGL